MGKSIIWAEMTVAEIRVYLEKRPKVIHPAPALRDGREVYRDIAFTGGVVILTKETIGVLC